MYKHYITINYNFFIEIIKVLYLNLLIRISHIFYVNKLVRLLKS